MSSLVLQGCLDCVKVCNSHIKLLLQFIGMSWNDACLEYFQGGSAVTTASAHQVREAPHQRSVNHWRNFEDELRPVSELLSG